MTDTKENKTDVFLSHDWGVGAKNHKRVSLINAALKRLGFKTWFDEEEMCGDCEQKMYDGIINSQAVLVFVTENYVNKVNGENTKDNCHLEFRFSADHHDYPRMVAVVVEESMKDMKIWKSGTGKLGRTLMSRKMYVDMSGDVSDKNYLEAQLKALIKELKEMDIVPGCGEVAVQNAEERKKEQSSGWEKEEKAEEVKATLGKTSAPKKEDKSELKSVSCPGSLLTPKIIEKKLNVEELRMELEALGLKSDGKKVMLIARLMDYVERHKRGGEDKDVVYSEDAQCPRGHPLIICNSSKSFDRWVCCNCLQINDVPDVKHLRCRTCDYDICEECVSKKQEEDTSFKKLRRMYDACYKMWACEGGLEMAQLYGLLQKMGVPVNFQNMRQIFGILDVDGNGKIDFQELSVGYRVLTCNPDEEYYDSVDDDIDGRHLSVVYDGAELTQDMIDGMIVKDLREELSARRMSTSGKKAEMVRRLSSFIEETASMGLEDSEDKEGADDAFSSTNIKSVTPSIQRQMKRLSISDSPNNSRRNSLGLPKVPKLLEVKSDNAAYGVGIYELTDEEFNDKPMWKHVDNEYYICFTDRGFWGMTDDVNSNLFDILSVKTDLSLPTKNGAEWQFANESKEWEFDKTLTVTVYDGVLPEVLEVVSTGKAARFKESASSIGVYQLSSKKFNNRPVWKHTKEKKYFYRTMEGEWVVADRVGADVFYIQSAYGTYTSPLILGAEWEYTNGNHGWEADDTLVVRAHKGNNRRSITQG